MSRAAHRRVEESDSESDDESTKPEAIDMSIGASVQYVCPNQDHSVMATGVITDFGIAKVGDNMVLTIERHDNDQEEKVCETQVIDNVEKPPSTTPEPTSDDDLVRELEENMQSSEEGTQLDTKKAKEAKEANVAAEAAEGKEAEVVAAAKARDEEASRNWGPTEATCGNFAFGSGNWVQFHNKAGVIVKGQVHKYNGEKVLRVNVQSWGETITVSTTDVPVTATDTPSAYDLRRDDYLQAVTELLVDAASCLDFFTVKQKKLSDKLKSTVGDIKKAHDMHQDFDTTWNALTECVPKHKGIWEHIKKSVGTFPSADAEAKSPVDSDGIPAADLDSEEDEDEKWEKKKHAEIMAAQRAMPKAYDALAEVMAEKEKGEKKGEKKGEEEQKPKRRPACRDAKPRVKKQKVVEKADSDTDEMDVAEPASTFDMVEKIVADLHVHKYPNYLKNRASCRNVKMTDSLLSEFHDSTPLKKLFAYTNKQLDAPDKNSCKMVAGILYLVLATNTAHYTDLESALRYFKHTEAPLAKVFLCMRVLNKVPDGQPMVQNVANIMHKCILTLV